MGLPQDTMVLVLDGARMLLLRNAGDAIVPDLQLIEQRQYQGLPSRELSSDAPGTTFSSGSPARSSYDEGDPHAQQEADFVRSAARALEAALIDHAGAVIVVADPRSLGVLRAAYSDRLRAKVSVEVDKDMTHLPIPQIAQRLMLL